MKNTLTFEEFQATVAEILDIDKDVIKEESIIYQDIGIDSLGVVNLGTKIQKQYEIGIAPAAIVEVNTVGELYGVIKELVESKLSA